MSASTSARAIATLRKTSLTSRTPCLRRTSPSTIIARASPLRNNSVAGPSCALRTLSRTYATQNKMSSPPEKKMVHFPKMTTEFPAKSQEFRRVLWTGISSQLVEMTIPVGGDIGEEVHHVDQHLIFTQGQCKAIVSGEEKQINAGDMVIVPQGSKHNFINTGNEPLVCFTVYAPAEHDPNSVHKTKEEGDKLEDEGKDEPPKWAQPGKQ